MHHLAIMNPHWGLLPKILTGEKSIESRWYKNKFAPWGKIRVGDTVYFKDSGKPVTVRTSVSSVLAFDNLNPDKVHQILDKYGQQDGIRSDKIDHYYQLFKDKKYCLLIFLSEVQPIPPFTIDKSGFGSMSAWICIDNINQIKVGKIRADFQR